MEPRTKDEKLLKVTWIIELAQSKNLAEHYEIKPLLDEAKNIIESVIDDLDRV